MSLEASLELRLGDLDLVFDLCVSAGETVAVLGPNGAGKTTLLRALAGLVPLRRGRVALDGEVVEDCARGVWVPPERRSIGLVYQDYRLFPHLSALENVAFGLRCRSMPRRAARQTARRWLERLGVAEKSGLRPAALSGGQQQRVAIARALAIEPLLLLLDEPLAALDAGSRAEVRRDLRRHLAAFPGVRLLVTHDPIEAISLAHRIIVLEGGRVTQQGTPVEVTAMPRSRYVADLAGVNLFRARGRGDLVEVEGGGTLVVPGAGAGELFAIIHPRAVALHRARPEGSPRNVWCAIVEGIDREGSWVRVRVRADLTIVAEVTAAAVAELGIEVGGEVWTTVKAAEIRTYPA